MKKYPLSIAVLLLSATLAYPQGADDLGKFAEVTVIPRMDLNPSYDFNSGKWGFDLGGSSVSSLIEGRASESFSWIISNNWVNLCDQPLGLPYTNMGKSGEDSLFGYLRADIALSDNWTFSLGKDIMATGGIEYADWDWETYDISNSGIADGLQPYQWGSRIAYTTPSGRNTFTGQITTSPFGEHPFTSGLYTYSAMWEGECERLTNVWSVTAVGKAGGGYDWLVWLGNRFDLSESCALTLEWNNGYGFDDGYTSIMRGGNLQGRFTYSACDMLSASLRAVYSYSTEDSSLDGYKLSTVLECRPIRGNGSFLMHAVAGYDSFAGSLYLSFGARYYLYFRKDWK